MKCLHGVHAEVCLWSSIKERGRDTSCSFLCLLPPVKKMRLDRLQESPTSVVSTGDGHELLLQHNTIEQ